MSTWQIDAAHTDVSFSVKHMMVTTVRGKFGEVSGQLELDLVNEDPTTVGGEIRLRVASLATGSSQRDEHLRSADFFDAERYPEIVARLVRVEPDGDRYRVLADVTIRDVTRVVEFEGRYLGRVPNMQGGQHAGFELTGTIDREAWGLNWNMALEAGGWLVGKEVRLSIDVAADEVAVSEQQPVGEAVAA